MSRKRFSEAEVLRTVMAQGTVVKCYRCRQQFHLWDKIEREHVLEIALGGKDEYHNCVYSHASCHDTITNGTKATSAGSSKQRIAKVKRLQGLTCTGPKKKIQSRGFDKRSRSSFRQSPGNVRHIDREEV